MISIVLRGNQVQDVSAPDVLPRGFTFLDISLDFQAKAGL